MTPGRSGLNFIVKAVAKLSGFMVLKKNTQTANNNDKYRKTKTKTKNKYTDI